MRCCQSILKDLTCSKHLKIDQDTATALLEANFSKQLIAEDVKTDEERAWLEAPINPKEEQWIEAQSKAYILLTKHAFQNRKLPSEGEFKIGGSVQASLSIYCDGIAEDHNRIVIVKWRKIDFTLYDLTRSYLFMNCCYELFNKYGCNRDRMDCYDADRLRDRTMMKNFSPHWDGRPKLLVHDQEELWFQHVYKWSFDRFKGMILLGNSNFKEWTPPTNNDLMEGPLSTALIKYFDQVIKEKNIDW